MKHTIQQLDAAINAANFKANSDWQAAINALNCLDNGNSALIQVNNVQLGTLARAMQVETDKNENNYSLTFENNGVVVILQTQIISNK
tara:strand:- start:204 stop:467 length:264 start_codon:yes stop_codon:yes gene_type:complete